MYLQTILSKKSHLPFRLGKVCCRDIHVPVSYTHLFYQAETHKRFFALLEANSIRVNRFRADCGSVSYTHLDIVLYTCQFILMEYAAHPFDGIFAVGSPYDQFCLLYTSICLPGITGRLHSSFVVFYFVFVL